MGRRSLLTLNVIVFTAKILPFFSSSHSCEKGHPVHMMCFFFFFFFFFGFSLHVTDKWNGVAMAKVCI